MTKTEKQKIAMEFIDEWFIDNKFKEDAWRRTVFGIYLKRKMQKINRWRALSRGKSARYGKGV